MNLRRLFMGIVLLLIGSVSVKAQRTISGVVTDSANQAPLQSVTILVKGSKKGTQTTQDGKFTLNVPANATTLVVSSVGYGTKEVAVSENLSISLSASNTSLNEVVVIGYGTTRKKDLTGSIATVSEKDFQKGNIVTPEQLIAGKVAGVQIVSNGGAPGAGSTIRIRGGASLNASNDPLIVIDGVPLSNNAISGSPNPLSLINPNDIASMNILKDASATAIYGSRASNGVIIITTKKGRSGKPQLSFNTQLTLSTPVKKVDVLNAAQFKGVIDSTGTSTQKDLLGDANTDWQDQIYQNALAEDNNLSVSGALKNMPYRISVGFLNQDGILKTGNLKRTSAGINLSPSLFDNHLKIDINFKGAESKSNFANQDAIGSAIIFDPTKPVYSGDKRFGGYYEWLDPSTGLPNTLSARNPVGLLNQKDDKSTVYRSIGNVQLDYKLHFFPDLHAIVNVGYDASRGTGTIFIPDSAASNYVSKGQNNHYKQTTTNTVLEAYFSYNKDIASINSHVDAVAGYSYNDFLTTNYNFASFNAQGDTIANSQPNFPFDKPRYTLISFYGRLNYNYKEKYFITGSLRDDGSSKFAPENRWGLFPAAAFAWRIKNEDFLRNSRVVSDLKLRLGYGKTGQQEGIDYYSYISFYNLSNSTAEYQLGDNYYQMYRPGGYYLQRTWEKTATYNVGLDYGFLNNRINGSIDVYYKKTTDLLNQIDQPAGTNFSNKIVANVGSMENRGVEFNLNVTPVKNAVIWNVNFNVTYNKNKITNLTISPDPNFPGNQLGTFSGGTGNTIQINALGYNRASFYVYQQVYDDAGKPIEGLFADRNRDGIINEKDLYEYKNPDPRFFYGLSSDVSWKNWSAGFTARASYGNYIYNNVYSNLGRLSTVTGVTAILNNASVNYLETGFAGTSIRELQSDYYIQNASFIRMDNIYIGFNAGNVFGGNTNLRISAGVQNAFTITKYDGIDPEVGSGIDYNFYPRPRNYVLGATLDF